MLQVFGIESRVTISFQINLVYFRRLLEILLLSFFFFFLPENSFHEQFKLWITEGWFVFSPPNFYTIIRIVKRRRLENA